MNRTTSKVLSVALLAGALLVPGSVGAQDHPNLERGFAAEKVYDFSGLDSVNLFNGNLTLTIPLGQSYKANGALAFGLSLVYNSNVWDYQQRVDQQGTHTQARLTTFANAGVGWRVSLGELIPPTRPGNESGHWIYVGPDGAEHTFYDQLHYLTAADGGCFTRDGSYLRLRAVSEGGVNRPTNCTGNTELRFWVDFPDGSSHYFTRSGTSGTLKLVKIKDSFNNEILVNQGTSTWSIYDGFRTHYIRFENRAFSGMKVVKEVDLAAFNDGTNGGRAVYLFSYRDTTISRSCKHDDDTVPSTVKVSFLKSVSLPSDGGFWQMDGANDYYETCFEAATGENLEIPDLPGVLRKIRLPTRGQIAWDWQGYGYPVRDVQAPESLIFQSSVGVWKKRFLKEDGSPYDGNPVPWLYEWHRIGQQVPPWERFTSVTDPLGNVTVNYFDDNPNRTGSNWDATGWEYGLPFKKTSPNGSSPERYLSREVFNSSGQKLRSVYVTYDHSRLPSPGAESGYTSDSWMNSNRRLISEKTVYHDDSDNWASTDYSSFDGLGNFRSVASDGGAFLRGNEHVQFTNYNPGQNYPSGFTMPAVGSPWILGLYDRIDQIDPENGNQTFREEFEFDATGFLNCQRWRKASTGRDQYDVLVVYQKDASGNRNAETWYGGDRQSIGTGSVCSAAASGTYRTEFGWSYGSVSYSRNRGPGGLEPHFNFRRDIDPNTGLTAVEYDASDYKTRLTYDSLGRMTLAEPLGDPGENEDGASTEYDFDRAVGGTLANVVVKVKCSLSVDCPTPTMAEKQYWFDGFGRLSLEKVLRDTGTYAFRETIYHPMGWKRRQSEWGPNSSTLKYTNFNSYDPFGRPGKIIPPDGTLDTHEIDLEYWGVQRTRRTVDIGINPTGAETEVSSNEYYDRFGRLTRVDEKAGPSMVGSVGASVITRYWYDAAGRLRHVTMADSESTLEQVRTFNYDGRGFLLSENHPEKSGPVIYRQYDAKGHAWEVEDGGPDRKLGFVYDASERLTRVSELGGRVLKEFNYDRTGGSRSLGKLEESVRHNYVWGPSFDQDVEVAETYTYGSYGRRVTHRSTQIAIAGVNQERFEQGWAYDRAGQVKSVDYPLGFGGIFGAGSTTPRLVNRTWTNGFLTGTAGVSMAYHPNGMLSTIWHTDGTRTELSKDPNDLRRPAEIQVKNSSGATLWTTGAYVYDGGGNIRRMGSDQFYYDGASRVTRADLSVGGTPRWQKYTYDSFGNIHSVETDGVIVNTPTSKETNRLQSFGYDASGNLLSWNGQRYWYDRLNMLNRYCSLWGSSSADEGGETEIPSPPFTCLGEDWQSIYTADDERIWFRRINGSGQAFTPRDLDGTVLRRFFSDTVWYDFVYRNGQLLMRIYGGVMSYHLDHLGTARYSTNPAGGLISEHEYFPYGQEATAPQHGDVMRFTGHERDLLSTWQNPADDLDYMHARLHSPTTGRFLSTDIASAEHSRPQSWNRYAYVRGNPVRFTDPSGKYTFAPCADGDKECVKNQKAFDKAWHSASESSIEAERQAALALGKPGVDNGVVVHFGDGSNTTSGGPNAEGPLPVKVTIKSGLRGLGLRLALSHEGLHTADFQAYFSSRGEKAFSYDPKLNYTRYDGENRAFHQDHELLKAIGRTWQYEGGFVLGKGVTGPAVQTAIDGILARKPYEVTPANPGPRMSQ